MIPVFRPSYGQEEFEAVKAVLESGWVGLGPKTQEFEAAFAQYIGTKFAVGTHSCTAALHLAMMAMDIEGGEVITTPMTFISTNHAILYNNVEPVFCDIEPDTLNIDASKISELVTPKTKAIVVVHYGGHPCDMDAVLKTAEEHGLKVIEDCAHACGSEYKGRKLGSIGDIACFSFHAVKNLATGEGGMITTNDPRVHERLMRLRWMGITKDTWAREERDFEKYSWYYDVAEVGFKHHMSDIAAAIGLVQLSKLDSLNTRRREVWERYCSELGQQPGLENPVRKDYATSLSCHNYVVKVDQRDVLNDYLKERGISTGVHYVPNNHYPMYRDCRGPTPIAESIWLRLLSLPIFPDLGTEDHARIVDEIQRFCGSRIAGTAEPLLAD